VRAKVAAIAVAACLGSSSPSAADGSGSGQADPDYFHVVVPWHLHIDEGSDKPPVDISMGSAHVYLDADWSKLDSEFRRLQAEDTRLTAENGSYKKTLEKWQPGLVTVLTGVAAGCVLGWITHEYVWPHL
jgi:hypothetical protein